MLDSDIYKAIAEAKAKGHTIEVRHAKIMVCGSSAAGKTNFINLLIGDKFVDVHEATAVTSAKDTMVKEIIVSENDDNLVEFRNCDLDHQIQILKSHLHYKQFKRADSDINGESVFKDDVFEAELSIESRPNQEVSELTENEVDVTLFQSESKSEMKHELETTSNTIPTSTVLSDNLASGHRSDIENKLAIVTNDIVKLPKTWDMLTFLDTGGQPEYISMLPAVNSSVMITFVVLSLEHDLSQNVAVFRGDSFDQPSHSLPYDYITLIKMLVSMRKPQMVMIPHDVLAHEAENKSYLSFIGTKSDIITEKLDRNLGEVVDNIDKELQKHLVACLPDVLKFVDGKYLTAVSNCNAGNKDEDKNAKKIRLKLYAKMREAAAVYNIPIPWLLLELEIKSWCVQNTRNFMKLQEIKDLCGRCDLLTDNVKDVEKFLKFYHILGVFLYYVEIEYDIIITNVQWFFKNLSKLVTFTNVIDNRQDHEKLLKQGLVTKKIFQQMQFDVSDDLTVDYFIKVFEILNIMALYNSDRGQYFVPCILTTCNLDSIAHLLEKIGNDHGKEPLLFQISGTEDCTELHSNDVYFGFPKGVFCGLVSYLVRRNAHDYCHLTLLLSPEFLHSNFIVFQYFDDVDDDDKYNIVLLDRHTHLEIQIRCENLKKTVYQDIRDLVHISLLCVVSKLNFSANSVCVAFNCRECKGESHLTRNTIERIKSNKPFHCLPNTAEDKKYLRSVWFEDIALVSNMCSKLTLT